MSVRVFGDRQTGKTEMLLAFAEKLCRQGRRVLYITHDQKLARDCLFRVEDSVRDVDGFQCYRSNGNERVVHESGGELRFIGVNSGARGLTVDTLFLDDVPMESEFTFLPALAASRDPHVIKASL